MKNISYLKLKRVRKHRGTASRGEWERSENPSNVYVRPLLSIVVGFSVYGNKIFYLFSYNLKAV
jgi:hypothetical protein